MNFRHMRIGPRLALGFGVAILLSIMLASLAYFQIRSLSGEINTMLKDRYPKTVIANKIKTDMSEVTRSMLNVLIMTDPTQIKKELGTIDEKSANINTAIATLKNIITDDKGREQVKAIAETQARFEPVKASFVQLIAADDKDGAMTKFLFALRPAQSKYFVLLDNFVAHQNRELEQAGEVSTAAADRTETLILFLAVIATVISVVAGYLSARSITGPLTSAVKMAKTVAAGDLTSHIEVRSRDETGQLLQALKDMNESLVRIVGEVRTGTETISTASNEIASGNFDLSERTEQQAESLQQTVASMLQLTGTVKQNADNARQANQLTAAASAVAVKGGNAVAEVVATMGSINESSRKIVDIIGVIDGIAFQTNILALNAAVEAARAGEQGRGFAVVASEVRNLAQRSAGAAKEIKTLIGDSVEKVALGCNLVGQAGATMDEVVASVKRVTDIMAEITAASEEQSAGIEQVNRAIGQIDEVTQQNAALVEEATAAAESMQTQAGNLSQVVSVFKLEAGHRPAPPARTRAQPRKTATSRPPAAAFSASASAARPLQVAAASKPARGKDSSGDEWEEF